MERDDDHADEDEAEAGDEVLADSVGVSSHGDFDDHVHYIAQHERNEVLQPSRRKM